MADAKTTALSANTTPADTDILPMVDDPAGTAATQKMTLATLKTFVQASIGSTGNGVSSVPLGATSTFGVVVTGDSNANTKGAWTELVASTAVAAESVQIVLMLASQVASTATGQLLDIGIGAGGAETVWFPDLLVGFMPSFASGAVGQIGTQTYIIPKTLAAGSRISARLAGQVVSDTMRVGVILRQAGDSSVTPTSVVAYGIDSANSGGTALTTVGANNTKGAWTQLTASTSADITHLLVAMQASNTNAVGQGDGLVDIGIGAAASEVAIISDLPYCSNSTQDWFVSRGCEMAFRRAIPAGTRISARYAAQTTTAGSKPAVAVYGLL